MREAQVVSWIDRTLNWADRWHINNHGTMYGSRGVPDFITCDPTGRLCGIEAKAPGQRPRVNQLRQAIDILDSGGRYLVVSGGDDDLLEAVFAECADKTFTIARTHGSAEFTAAETFPATTGIIEVVLAVNDGDKEPGCAA